MSRSKWKGPYTNEKILNESLTIIKTQSRKKVFVLKTMSRDSEIIHSFVGLTFSVHNGKTFSNVEIKKEMIGHKLGEFVFTRSHSPPKKKKVKRKVAFKKK